MLNREAFLNIESIHLFCFLWYAILKKKIQSCLINVLHVISCKVLHAPFSKNKKKSVISLLWEKKKGYAKSVFIKAGFLSVYQSSKAAHSGRSKLTKRWDSNKGASRGFILVQLENGVLAQ